MKVRDRVRRTRIPRVRILFMLYLFEFFELNNLHVVMTMVIHRNDGKSAVGHELLLVAHPLPDHRPDY